MAHQIELLSAKGRRLPIGLPRGEPHVLAWENGRLKRNGTAVVSAAGAGDQGRRIATHPEGVRGVELARSLLLGFPRGRPRALNVWGSWTPPHKLAQHAVTAAAH